MPSDALAIAPAILAVVLVVSAVGKLRSPSRSAEAFRDLRVPAPLNARPVVEALPWAELLLALLLVVAGGWLGVLASVAAVLLFTAYLVLVVRALGFEAPVDCACFGEFAPGRIGRRTVVRNAWLLALAAVAVLASPGGSSLIARIIDGNVPWWWLVAAAAAAITVLLVVGGPGRAAGDAQADSGSLAVEEGEYLRTRTPALPVVLGDGSSTDLRTLSRDRAQLLVYVSEACNSCVETIEAVPAWRDQMPQIDIRYVTGAAAEVTPLASADEPRSIHDTDGLLRETFAMRGTPSALLLGADGLLAGGPVVGGMAVPEFVEDVLVELRSADAPSDAARAD